MNPSRLLPILLALALLPACSREKTTPAVELPSVKVQALLVRNAEMPVLTELSGTVRPVQRAVVAAKLMGVIESLPVALGQSVAKGDLLVRLSAAEIEARVSQAQVGLAQAKRELARERELQSKGATTADLVHSLGERLESAEALLREALALRDYSALRAPFSGVISKKYVLAGDLASPGQALLELEGDSAFEVELGVPDSLRGSLVVGSVIPVSVPSSGLAFSAAVRELSSAADTQARSITAKLTVPAGITVHSGQYVRVQVPSASVQVRLVPVSSISLLGQMERVFTVHEGRARLHLVRTGATHGNLVEVVSGLAEGESIISAPPLNLRDGQLVEVQK